MILNEVIYLKIAIFNYYGMDSAVGGPRGYISNLYVGFKSIGIAPPTFLCSKEVKKNVAKEKTDVKSSNPSDIRCVAAFIKKGLSFRKEFKKVVRQYDVIHVHSTDDCYYLRKFAGFKGKIILTSHRPESSVEEKFSSLGISSEEKYRLSSILFRWVESSAYKYTDAFIFPSKGAMEIYNQFPGFTKNIKNKPVHFVITGTTKKEVKMSNEEFRLKHNIAPSDFVLTFIGRHNYIKGYDRVVNAYEDLKKAGIKVCVAGKVSDDIEYPSDPNWMEFGYINYTMDLMQASDIIAIPNRNTYFDLVIIEAISAGKIVISSNTGGNNDISKFTDGLVLFDNDNETDFISKVLEVKDMDTRKLQTMKKNNLLFYNTHCTISKFAASYIKELNEIITELKVI